MTTPRNTELTGETETCPKCGLPGVATWRSVEWRSGVYVGQVVHVHRVRQTTICAGEHRRVEGRSR